MPKETVRDRLKDVISFFLSEQKMFCADDAYESSCEIADNIFNEFNIVPEEQDSKGVMIVKYWGGF